MPELPPPPDLQVTSPERGLIQSGEAQVTVTGTPRPGSDGSPVSKVTVNGQSTKVAADGSFTATPDEGDPVTVRPAAPAEAPAE